MIVGSVLLVIVAAVLLGFGLVRLDAPLLYSSIGVSALAALSLAVGVRRMAAVRAGRGTIAVRPVVRPPRPVGRATPRPVGRATVAVAPIDASTGDAASADDPAPEAVSEVDLARLERLEVTVVVVDGRPRFHLADCGHLVGQPSEPVPVAEAIELGFTACGQCRPATTLLTEMGDSAAGGPSALT